jgi:predicted DNA repair protein MutK
MPSGLVALLDDISVIAKAAAASLDDVGLAATRAGTKAAGVVIDDAAVTPSYVTNFTPDRELPVIAKIAKGSLKNKLLFILPAALLLSTFFPLGVTLLLLVGGLYLAFEGAEKVIEKLGGEKHGETLEDPVADPVAFEQQRVSGAVRTDFILSAEIMVIALAEVDHEPLLSQAVILIVVAVAITVLVYGAVGLIVKMDDIGLHYAKRPRTRRLGTALVNAMPVVLTVLASVGTVAMLWVGGGIVLHALEQLGVAGPAHVAHAIQHAVEHATGPLSGVLGWLAYAVASAVAGLVLGGLVAWAVHQVQKLRGQKVHQGHAH